AQALLKYGRLNDRSHGITLWTAAVFVSEAVIRDLAKAGVRRLGHYRAETGFKAQRLQQDTGPHRFSQSEDAHAGPAADQPADPAMYIIGLEESIRGQFPFARSMRAAVGGQGVVSMAQEKIGEAEHPGAIIG